jgi:hypothetical protein
VNQHPRSYTADETGTVDHETIESDYILACGHPIQNDVAEAVLAEDSTEPVWCPECRADRPIDALCLDRRTLDPGTPKKGTTMSDQFRKGDKVIGLGRYGSTWKSRPIGVVTGRRRGWIRVQWDNCCVEDEMRPEWLAR